MEVITWERLCDYIRKQLPAVIPIAGERKIVFAVGRGASSISLRIPYTGKTFAPASPYEEISYQVVLVEGRYHLELSTSANDLFHGFYLFAALVASNIEEQKLDVLDAIQRAQQTFGQLLSKRTLLSEAQQIGLIGELAFLDAALTGWGYTTLKAWVGPAGERHDFRIEDVEIEVKSTMSPFRRHVINGLSQLEASPKKRLYVLSIQLERAGRNEVKTLPARIARIRTKLSGHAEELLRYDEYLRMLGYVDADAALYGQAYQLRSLPSIIQVDDSFPRITSAKIESIVSKSLAPRISEVQYEVDLEGLGELEGSPLYEKVLHNLPALE